MRSPARFLLVVLLIVAGLKLSEQLYRWAVFGEERARIKTIRAELPEVGAELVEARAEGDSIRALVEEHDRRLEAEGRALNRYRRQARHGLLPPDVYEEYRAERERYEEHILQRDALVREWEQTHDREHAAVVRYNLLADSIHALAVRIGEPYYTVPSALEAARERRAEVRDEHP